MYRHWRRRFWLIAVAILLLLPIRAWAAPGMCAITGTVYNVDGSVAANSDVIFRLVSTQTFGGDTVQTSPEVVQLSALGVLPGGVQIPLGARVFIQVGRDKPVSVVAPLSGGSCPITFGALYGSALTSPPPATTIVTSIGATNNAAGFTLSTTNPAGAGPATIALAGASNGTFTPTITGSTTNPTVTYTNQIGDWSIVGDLIYVDFNITWTAFSGGSGNLRVSTAPQTLVGSSGNSASWCVGQWGGITLGANYTQLMGRMVAGNTFYDYIESGSGQTAANIAVGAAAAAGQLSCSIVYRWQ